ncbi:MAG TPA: ABC transporter substrate-binding protein, partial [Hyphomicrobiaceae bacterium]|nr:ABC transporter substrate-binding protein [Hyphomicrobiaceae bacterium]
MLSVSAHQKIITVLGVLAVAWSALVAGAGRAPAQLLEPKPHTIAVMLSSDRSGCFAPGVVSAIKYFTTARRQQLNAKGGVNGRKLQLKFYDDFTDANKTRANFASAFSDPNLIGIVGLSSSTRGKSVIDDVGASGIPFISGMSRDDFFASYPNAFSIEPAAGAEIAIIQKFVQSQNFRRPAYIGFSGDLYAERYQHALAQSTPDGTQLITHRFTQHEDFRLDEAVVRTVIQDIKAKSPDIIFMGIHSGPGGRFIKKLNEAGIRIPVFVILGRIERMRLVLGGGPMQQTMYQLAREGIPNVFNERLRQRIWRNPDVQWIFQDKRLP